jgi:hypothetical protein
LQAQVFWHGLIAPRIHIITMADTSLAPPAAMVATATQTAFSLWGESNIGSHHSSRLISPDVVSSPTFHGAKANAGLSINKSSRIEPVQRVAPPFSK